MEWERALMQNVDEFRLLFPVRKITTSDIYDWGGRIKSKNTVRRTLMKNLNHVHHARCSYFENQATQQK